MWLWQVGIRGLQEPIHAYSTSRKSFPYNILKYGAAIGDIYYPSRSIDWIEELNVNKYKLRPDVKKKQASATVPVGGIRKAVHLRRIKVLRRD